MTPTGNKMPTAAASTKATSLKWEHGLRQMGDPSLQDQGRRLGALQGEGMSCQQQDNWTSGPEVASLVKPSLLSLWVVGIGPWRTMWIWDLGTYIHVMLAS